MSGLTAPEFTETTAFLNEVLLDGRYIGALREQPLEVARALGTEISPAGVRELTSADLDTLLEELYDARFNPRTVPLHPYLVQQAETPRGASLIFVGIVIGVVGIAIAVGVSIKMTSAPAPAPPPPPPPPPATPPGGTGGASPFAMGVVDYSPQAASKL